MTDTIEPCWLCRSNRRVIATDHNRVIWRCEGPCTDSVEEVVE